MPRTPDEEPDPPRLGYGKVRKAGRKRPVSPEKKRAINQRIEEVRILMSLNYSDGDLKRMLAEKWGIKPRSVAKYLVVARERQRQLLARDDNEARSDSVGYWGREQQDAKRRAAEARKRLESAQKVIEETDKLLSSPEGDHPREVCEIALERQKAAVKRVDDARRTIWSSERRADEIQDRIDKLLGNHAPLKIAKTDVEGKDVPVEAPPEPVDADRELEDLLAVVEARSVPGVN